MLLVAVAAVSACEKNAVQLIAGPQTGGANIKFFNFAVGSPQVNFYVNDTKYTGVAATGCYILTNENRAACTSTGIEATTGIAYGSSANSANAWYSDVAPGAVKVEGKIAAATDKDLSISSVQGTVAEGKFYSYYLSGVYSTATKSADSFMLEDVLPAVDFSTAYVRFVHASNLAPMTLYAINPTTSAETAVGAEIAYKSGTAFVAIPAGSYNLATRYAGSSTNAVLRTAVSFATGRVYTVTVRGNPTLALDNTANR